MPRLSTFLGVAALATVAWLSASSNAAAGPDALPAFDSEAATDAYLATVTGAARERSDAYFEGGYWVGVLGFMVSMAVYTGLLHLGVSARLRDAASRVFKRPTLAPVGYWVLFLAATTLLLLPWDWYTGFSREHAYELSNLSLGEWFGEKAKGLVLGAVFGSIGIAIFFAVLRRAPRRWWMWGVGLAMSFAMLGATIAPVYLAPMFNEYTPLEDGPIKESVLRMASANGIDAEEVWMSNASKQSTRISANVSGMFGTERITLNDNLLDRCSPEEVEAVMGHEIGHYVLNHSYEMLLFMLVTITGMFLWARWFVEWALRRWGDRWGVRGISDPAVLPVFLIAFQIFFAAMTPLTNTMIRVNEAEADAFGLNAARQPDGFAEVSLKLGEYRKLEPGPLEEWVFFDHPSGRSRISMAMDWKAQYLDE